MKSDLNAEELSPFVNSVSKRDIEDLKDTLVKTPNKRFTLPGQQLRYLSEPSDIAAIVAVCWHPKLVEHCLNSGAIVPINSAVWHADLCDVWISAVKNKTAKEVEQKACDFAESLHLLQNARYDFAEHQKPKGLNPRDRRLSFLHCVAWRVFPSAHPELLFRECVAHNIPVSADILGDIKYMNDLTPNLCQQVQHYVLSQATGASQTSKHKTKRHAKI